MPAPAIIGAVVAVAAAAEIATPVAIGLAVIATAGAVASTVGTITGDKTLSMVGNIMGAVGSIGGIANGLGVFGEVAGGLSGVTNAAGGTVETVAPTAMSVSEATGGLNAYTPEFLQAANESISNTGAFAVNSAEAGAQAASQPGEIVNMLEGAVRQVPTAEAPPAASLATPDPTPPAATDAAVSPEGLAPAPAQDLAVDPAKDLSKGLINADQPPQVTPAEWGVNPDNGAVPMVDSGGNPALNLADGSMQDPRVMAQGEELQYGMGSSSPAGPGGVNANQPLLQSTMEPSNGPQNPTDVRPGANEYGAGWGDRAASGAPPAVQPNNVSVTGNVGGGTPPPAQPAQAPAQNVTGNVDMTTTPWDGGVPGSAASAIRAVNKVGPAPAGEPSIWDSIWSFAKDNKSLVLGGMMSLGSFMSGALSPKTPAEVEELNARAEANRAAAQLQATQNQLMQRRLNNMSQPIPVAYRGGLINSGVTGRV